MGLPDGQLNKILYAVQGIGAVFAGLFLTVYLMGLQDVPKDVVYHSNPIFRTALSAVGIILIIVFFIALAAAAARKSKR